MRLRKKSSYSAGLYLRAESCEVHPALSLRFCARDEQQCTRDLDADLRVSSDLRIGSASEKSEITTELFEKPLPERNTL